MAKRKVKIVRPGDEQTTWRGAGDEYRVLATGDDTAGDYFMMEAVVPPGGGPPLHIQTREEEAFYVLEGEVVFHADGERIVAGPGVYLNIPRGVPHHFVNESDATVRMLIVFAPAGIERMFEKMSADPENYSAIANEYGVEFPSGNRGREKTPGKRCKERTRLVSRDASPNTPRLLRLSRCLISF